eukprot:11592312-Ditylum_brightwellii.AAC.1
MVNPVGDVACYSDDDTEVGNYAYCSTIGGDFAKDHEIKRKSGNYTNSYVCLLYTSDAADELDGVDL